VKSESTEVVAALNSLIIDEKNAQDCLHRTLDCTRSIDKVQKLMKIKENKGQHSSSNHSKATSSLSVGAASAWESLLKEEEDQKKKFEKAMLSKRS
jgi:hypothetical protein